MSGLLAAAIAIRDKLILARDGESFKSVLRTAHLHGTSYTGPDFGRELAVLCREIEAAEEAQTSQPVLQQAATA